MVSDAMNGIIVGTGHSSSSSSNSTAMMVASYPTLHTAAYTILQPFVVVPQHSTNSNITTTATNMYSQYDTEDYYTSMLTTGSMGDDSVSAGILGGTSLAIIPLTDPTYYSMTSTNHSLLDNPQSGLGVPINHIRSSNPSSSVTRSWTIPPQEAPRRHGASTNEMSATYANRMSLTSTMKQSTEWKVYQGQFVGDDDDDDMSADTKTGLYPLQQAFVNACTDRLMVPLQYMFHENVAISDDGVSMSTGIMILPSKYDLQRFDENIRNELALAAPSSNTSAIDVAITEDMTLIVQLVAQCVNTIINEFCARAKSAMSQVAHQQHHHQPHGASYINEKDWSMTESMKHDCKIIAILYTMKHYIQTAPEKVFVVPYRVTGGSAASGSHHSSLQQHTTKTALICSETLISAGVTIDTTIQNTILKPLCRTLNRLIATNILSKIHLGIYLDNNNNSHGSAARNNYEDMNEDDDIPLSFIQKDIVPILDQIVQVYLVKFPPTYSNMIVSNIVSFVIYSYLSNVTLIRPLNESIRLRITQDLTDLEMALDQFISKAATMGKNSKLNFANTGNESVTLSLPQVDRGRPYAELRAVRQMLFWTGLDTKSKPADDIAKSLLNEMWVKDIRPSTIFHYLFSYGPNTLSSPYHVKRISATEYVALLVPHDILFGYANGNTKSTDKDNNSMENGEDVAFMTIMACCDSYIQRASVTTTTSNSSSNDPNQGGDMRIAQIVITFGQELLRRRGRQ
jgi:hypothetical protein